MDFPGNTIKQRSWFKEIINTTKCNHELLYLKVDDNTCLEHLSKRREEHPDRIHIDTEETFHQVTNYFQEPVNEEGLNVKVINQK